jgi:hypothetical protein
VAFTADIRKVSLIMTIIIAMIAVLLPVCMVVQCGMGADQMAMGSHGLSFGGACVGTMTSGAQAAIAPGSPLSLILLLVAAFGGALVLTAPPLVVRPVRAMAEDPPPPPEDPRGERLII